MERLADSAGRSATQSYFAESHRQPSAGCRPALTPVTRVRPDLMPQRQDNETTAAALHQELRRVAPEVSHNESQF